VLIGYNVLNILSSALATMFITQVVPGAWGVAIATSVMTVLVVVFVEVLPKTLAIVRADDVARALSGPMLLVVRLLGPVIYAIQWIVRRTLRLFGVRLEMGDDVLAAHEEIRGAVEYHHSEGLVEGDDRRMLGGVLDLGELTVAEVMVHRRQIAMLDIGDAPREIVATRRTWSACCTPRTSPAPSPPRAASSSSTSPPSPRRPGSCPRPPT
jgi:Mg2+/Co2+ transporter CorB